MLKQRSRVACPEDILGQVLEEVQKEKGKGSLEHQIIKLFVDSGCPQPDLNRQSIEIIIRSEQEHGRQCRRRQAVGMFWAIMRFLANLVRELARGWGIGPLDPFNRDE